MTKEILTWGQTQELMTRLTQGLKGHTDAIAKNPVGRIAIWGIPRGGSIVAALLHARYENIFRLVDEKEKADFIIDDIIDSGATREKFSSSAPVVALIDKTITPRGWVVFPWEGETASDEEDIVRRLIQSIEKDPNREGLKDTPARIVKFYSEWLNPAEPKLTTFENEGCDEMIVQSGIQFYSLCEHHLLPFFGTATVAYIPGEKKIVGLSKLSRTVDYFANRLQNQERLTKQIAEYLQEHLDPKGVAVVLKARHLCMEMRGVKKNDAPTTTSALLGLFKADDKCRNEFLQLSK